MMPPAEAEVNIDSTESSPQSRVRLQSEATEFDSGQSESSSGVESMAESEDEAAAMAAPKGSRVSMVATQLKAGLQLREALQAIGDTKASQHALQALHTHHLPDM